MFAVYGGPFAPYIAVFGVVFALYCSVKFCREKGKLNLVGAVAGVFTSLVAVFIPPVARLSVYHEGKDQDEWARILVDGDAASRQEAITALCALMKRHPNRPSVTGVALDAFGKAKATEAIPFLLEFQKTCEQRHTQNWTINTIKKIDAAALPTEEEK